MVAVLVILCDRILTPVDPKLEDLIAINDEYLLVKLFEISLRINHPKQDDLFKKLIQYAIFDDIFHIQETRFLELVKSHLRNSSSENLDWVFTACIESLDPLYQSIDSQKLVSKLLAIVLPKIELDEDTCRYLRYFVLKTPFAVPRDTCTMIISSPAENTEITTLAFQYVNSLSTLDRLRGAAIWKWVKITHELCESSILLMFF
jgi:hypothetical protein